VKTIKQNIEFQKVFEKGHSIQSKYLVVYFHLNHLPEARFGFCAGKKLGTAVTRNHIKRLLREVVRNTNCSALEGWDLILLGRSPIINATWEVLLKDFKNIIIRARLTHTK